MNVVFPMFLVLVFVPAVAAQPAAEAPSHTSTYSLIVSMVAVLLTVVGMIYVATKDRRKTFDETIEALGRACKEIQGKVDGLSTSVSRYEGANLPKRVERAEAQLSVNTAAIERVEAMLKGIHDNIALVLKLLDERRARQERQ